MTAALIGAKKRRHGHTAGAGSSLTFRIWTNMKTRCGNPKASNFAYYGGRGIGFCDAWRSFDSFLRDMGEAPEGMSLDRIDSDGDYCKANCRWATKHQQANNRRGNRILNVYGERLTLSQAAALYGLFVGTVWSRLKRGWSDERAVSTPGRGGARP